LTRRLAYSAGLTSTNSTDGKIGIASDKSLSLNEACGLAYENSEKLPNGQDGNINNLLRTILRTERTIMKRSSTIFLQIVIVLIGIGALALMLWEPQIEGRNVHSTLFEIYFKDPFLAYAYIASIPFFMAFYQAFKVLGYVRLNKTFSQATVKALRTIKYCAIAIIGFVAVSVIFIMFADKDDRPAGVFMRILIAFPSIVIATAAAMFERILQNAVDIKSENDLTV
jgi:cytochrome bd-type quinol oxidase subunit 2